MKIVSVNVGLPREVHWKGVLVTTAIFKHPVANRVAVRGINLDGDRQADLSVHGGPFKAVYGYASEHYEYWRRELPEVDFNWGHFGENLTTEGLFEDELCIGDRLKFGTAILTVAQPRLPCYKLALRFDRDEIIKRFLASKKTGFYFSITAEGEVATGDAIEFLEREENKVSISDITRLYFSRRNEPELLKRVLKLKALPDFWKEELVARAERR